MKHNGDISTSLATLRGRGAFTLLEVLVVITVVSVLTAVAVPSFTAATSRARRLGCARNLAVQATAMTMYATIGNGWLPPGPVELGGSQWRDDPDRGSPMELYDASRPAAGLTSDQGWYGQGLTWKHQYVDRGQTYYCPEREIRGRGYRHAWPAAMTAERGPADGKSRIYGSYAYRGGLWSGRGTEYGPLNIHRNSGGLGLLVDYPGFGSMWHADGYNAAFLDGRVEYVHSTQPMVHDARLMVFWQVIGAFWDAPGPEASQ